MNEEMDLGGKSIVAVVDFIERIKRFNPFVGVAKMTDTSHLKFYAEHVDLFRRHARLWHQTE